MYCWRYIVTFFIKSVPYIRILWLVFIALAVTVRDKDHIALGLIYAWLPVKMAFITQQFLTLDIFCLGIVMIIYGIEAVTKVGGK